MGNSRALAIEQVLLSLTPERPVPKGQAVRLNVLVFRFAGKVACC